MKKMIVAFCVLVVGAVIAVAVLASKSASRAPPPERVRTATAITPRPAPLAWPSASTAARSQPELAAPDDPGVTRDPLGPDYDPAKLMQESAGPPMDLWDAEPRDQRWAPEREDVVQTLALRSLREVDPDTKFDIECRTAICRFHVDSNNKKMTGLLGVYPMGCLAKTYAVVLADLGSGSESTILPDYYLIFDKEGRSRDGLLAARDSCAKQHDLWLERMNGGNPPWP